MPFSRIWQYLARLLLAATAIIAVGWYIGHPALLILSAIAVFVAWHGINVVRLCKWLRHSERDIPDSRGLWADIFEHIGQMEERNQRQNERYQSMIGDFETLTNALPDATLVINENDEVTWSNRAASELLGLDEGALSGRQVGKLLRNPEFAEWLAVQDQLEGRLEIKAPGKDDTWLNVSAVPIRDKMRLIIMRDISELHHVDQIRRDFVTNISHELRTPLTVMLGYLELFLDKPGADMSEALPRMHAQAVQMKAMVDDFLELSRLQSVEKDGEDGRVEVPALLLQLREQAEEISRGSHELHFEIEEGLYVSGIASDLESAFRNLIVNALKYTPESGSVTVRWFEAAKGPTLEVADTGIGIPLREIPRLTERFYRVGSDRGRKTGGTGLGLAIVKHVMNAHQAQLDIQSEFGVGSRFSCVFPQDRKRA